MSTQLTRLSKVGMAIEGTPGTYAAPTFPVPFHTASFETVIDPLRDESVRADDAVLHGLYAGPAHSTFDLDCYMYPDLIGYWLRFLGPDTVTAATSTTLSSSAAIGATTISTAASIPAGSTIRIGTGASTEYAITGSPSGGGPYSIPIATPATGLVLAHTSASAVTTQTTHTFKQTTSSRPPSYSITVYETVGTLGFTYMTISDLAIKVDPKGIVTVSPKFVGCPETSVSPFTPSYSSLAPLLGWQWSMTNMGGASTRGLTYDLALKRATEVIFSSDGLQTPREVFSGALEADLTYKTIFESMTDMNEFLTNTQRATTALLTQPVQSAIDQSGGVQIGGASLALKTSVTAYHKSTRNLGQAYVQLDMSGSGVFNATDAGVVQATLKNYVTASY